MKPHENGKAADDRIQTRDLLRIAKNATAKPLPGGTVKNSNRLNIGKSFANFSKSK